MLKRAQILALDKPLITHKEKMQMNLRNQLFKVKYDLMEFNDLLGDEDFLESYN